MRGGKRDRAGRPPSPYVIKRVVVHFESEAEYRRYIASASPRERALAVLRGRDENRER